MDQQKRGGLMPRLRRIGPVDTSRSKSGSGRAGSPAAGAAIECPLWSAAVTEHAGKCIGEPADMRKRRFLYVAYSAPDHAFYQTRLWHYRFSEIKDAICRTYVSMIASIDALVARVRDALEPNGRRDKTKAFLISDTGYSVQLGACGCSRRLSAGKFTYADGTTRVWFIVSCPKRLKLPGVMGTRLVTLRILPTTLGANDNNGPAELTGHDLIVSARGDRRTVERTLIFGQDFVFASNRETWKLWASRDKSESHIYDLGADPGELTDLSQRNPSIARRQGRLIYDWRTSITAPLLPRHITVEAKMCAKTPDLVN